MIRNGESLITIAAANVRPKSFQQNVDGYTGTRDTYLDGEFSSDEFDLSPVIRVDQVAGEAFDESPVVRPQQGLLQFRDLFGDAIDQIPARFNDL